MGTWQLCENQASLMADVGSYLRKWESGEDTGLEQLSKNVYKMRRALTKESTINESINSEMTIYFSIS